jgi:hypothetical protein
MTHSNANRNRCTRAYLTVLQNIVCTRHADLASAYAEIDRVFQANLLKEGERRQLSSMARAHYEFGTGRPGFRGIDTTPPSLEKVGTAALAHSLAIDAIGEDVGLDPRSEEYKVLMRFAEQKQQDLGIAIREVAEGKS